MRGNSLILACAGMDWMNNLTLQEFLAHLRGQGVALGLEGDQLACSAPGGALTPPLRAELQRRKPELLAFLRSSEATRANAGSPQIRRTQRGPDHSLSHVQEGLWFIDQLEPGSGMYNVPCALRLTGHLDRSALKRTLEEILRRHESLRTSFRNIGGEPRAVISSAKDWTLDVVSLIGSASSEQETDLLRAKSERAARPFDLSQGPLARATLFQLSATEHVLLFVMHHIVSDGWSIGVYLKELGKLYEAFVEGRPSPLRELPIQYRDYAHWHRRWLEGGVLDAQLPYWKQSLAAPLPVLDLPLDRPRPAVPTDRGKRLVLTIPVSLTDGLKQLSQGEGASLFMTLLTAFKILLVRYTGQEDIVVGTPSANRGQPEFADLIGYFVNNIVLRSDLSGNPTVRECLRRVRQVTLNGFSHQDVPFDRLVEALRPDRSVNRTLLFQSLFAYQSYPVEKMELPGLAVRPEEIDAGTSRFDLTVEAVEFGGTIRFYFEFNTDLLNVESIQRLQRHYEALLDAMVAKPDSRIYELPMLSPTETAQLLVEWNQTAAPFLQTQSVYELIGAQAAHTPDAEALRWHEIRLSYRELVGRSNQLAQRLRALGIGPDSRVGLCVERTHELVVAALGIWAAGGAYVPLDPSYPKERLAFMAKDAGLAALVTESGLLEVIANPGCQVVCVDRDRDVIAREQSTAPDPLGGPHNLAYVIYTSGSTGNPKGVLIEHASVVNFLDSMRREPGFSSADCLLAVTTLSFDIAGLELFLPLITGGRLVLADRALAADGNLLARSLVENDVTVMQATPVTWRALLDTGWGDGRGLTILCGGEAMPRRLADELLGTGARVWNMYGPTETTIWSAIHRVGAQGDPVPIGRPIANTKTYILDSHLAPVPINVSGELYIGGAGVARGYHNRPELTAARFLPDPFTRATGARLYRTGDQARFRADGSIEYLGRLDGQIKLRGFRIELGEIESVLATHVGIEQVVAAVREDSPGDQRLVAYLTGVGTTVNGPALRAWLEERLPQFMIPSAFVGLTALPLTPNGKVDRKALPPPAGRPAGGNAPFVSPQAGFEAAVAEVWCKVLKVDRVGANENFFDLGGHSLLVVRVQAALRERFRCELSLMELFRRPTVSAIAQYLHTQKAQPHPRHDQPAASVAHD